MGEDGGRYEERFTKTKKPALLRGVLTWEFCKDGTQQRRTRHGDMVSHVALRLWSYIGIDGLGSVSLWIGRSLGIFRLVGWRLRLRYWGRTGCGSAWDGVYGEFCR